jgi:hypothetical protein
VSDRPKKKQPSLKQFVQIGFSRFFTLQAKAASAFRKHRSMVAFSKIRPSKTTKRWIIFWCAVFTALPFLIIFKEAVGIQQPAKLLIAVAVGSTAIFAHFSVLYPFLAPKNGLVKYASPVFVLIISIGIVSFLLGAYYVDLARHSKSIWINIDSLTASLKYVLPEFLFDTAKILFNWHTFIYIVLFFALDWTIGVWAFSQESRDEFLEVAWHIDFPMVIGVGFANLVHTYIPQVETDVTGGEYFLAGAVALQLFVANLQLLILSISHDSKRPRSRKK